MTARIVLVLCCLALVGCQDKNRRTPTQQEVYSSAKLETAPLVVRTAFRRDYPTGIAAKVDTISAQSGPLLYQITFYQDGQPRSASYTQDGSLFRTDTPRR